jgi:hypothetical protein
VATDYSTTNRTLPLFPLLLQEYFYAMLLNEIKIVKKAHVKESAISLVKMFQVLTGKIFTFITVFHFLVQQQIASFLEKSTSLVSWTTTLTIRYSDAFGFDIMLQGKVATANSTIHATRGNQFLPHIISLQF